MKKLHSKYILKAKAFTIIFFFLVNFNSFAQLITVNDASDPESSFNLEELVTSVLINSNCALLEDFNEVALGGPTDLTTKSYGFFKRPVGSNFPFENGLILTSGNAFQAGNTVIPGVNSNVLGLPGDTDLEAALGVINTGDATSVSFTFTPSSNNFSFNYLMASEEYNMNDECNFADSFAFLLRRVGTTNFTNLARVPVSNDPVSTINVRPDVRGPGGAILCTANNPDFFDGYDLGDTNYGGRTVVFNATAVVIPNVQYEIKLVIADQGDRLFDSAVFIEAGSFSGLGGNIPDFTVASGRPGCGDTAVTLDTAVTDPTATFEWFKLPDLVNPIPGETGPSLIVPSTGPFGGDGTYAVTISFGSSSCQSTEEAEVQFVNQPILESPPRDLVACETDGDNTEVFDLTLNSPLVIGAQSDVQAEYFDVGGRLITDPANYTNSTMPEIITVRVTNNSVAAGVGTCPVEDTFTLTVSGFVTAQDVTFQLCDNDLDGDDTNGFVEFNLSTINDDVLGTQNPLDFTVSYHPTFNDADLGLNPLPNLHTNGTANIESIFARVENNGNSGCYAVSDITLVVDVIPLANTVIDQLICDDNNDGFWDFNLDALRADVLLTQDPMQFEVSFHLEEAEAMTSSTTNPLPDTFTNLVAYDQDIIWVRIENINNTDCSAFTSFMIDVFDQPTATADTYELCDDDADGDDTNGFVEFTLSTRDLFILNGQDPSQFTVTYFETQPEAINGDPTIAINSAIPYVNAVANNDQVWARVTNIDNPDCFEVSTLNLVVNPLPVLDNAMVQLEQCDEFDTDSTDAISDFNLTQADQLIVNTITDEVFTYYTTLADAESGTSPITNALSFSNADAIGNQVYVRIENNEGCIRIAQLELIALTGQLPNTFAIAPFEECDDTRVDDNIIDGITVFDFSSAEASILALFPINQNISVDFYQNAADAASESNPIADISNHVNTASPFVQEIFFRVENDDDNTCEGAGSFELRTINPTPRTDTESVDIIVCDDVTIGDLVEEFNLTQNEVFIFDGIPNLSATYFLDFDDALNNVTANEITTPAVYNNTNPTETIYVRVLDTSTGCFAIVDFDITVNPLPIITTDIPPIEECENNTDGFFEFDLTQRRDDILNGQDPLLFNVTYHTTQQGADNLDLTEVPDPSAFTNTIVDVQEIFYAITNITTPNGVLCSNTGSFFVEVLEGAQANSDGEPLDFQICDDNIIGDDIAQFNFDDIQDEVLDGQDPADYTITYHFTENEAINYNPITDTSQLPNLYENLTNPQIVWVRVSNNISPNICFEVEPVTLTVNPLPVFELDPNYILCLSDQGAVVDVPLVLDTGLSGADHTFEWFLNGEILPLQTGSTLTPIQGGDYEVIATDNITMCMFSVSTTVTESSLPDPTTFDIRVTSEAFIGNNVITVNATGISTYEFSLDNGAWQLDNVFTNVTGGEHVVRVRDVQGCGVVMETVVVIDFPKFFTPNGDGTNDTWNIAGIGAQPSAKIYIFDRYGKLLKQISPTSPGWDGTFQGNNMPSSDYWFRLEYTEPTNNEMRTFTSHFSLKR
ncbi:MAG: gliding motility-associated C-terminal domain-containing protein [Winogradskyella sp.]|uniref:T9SS type B sorting domain-containing protein n=1 Tax=Winogradskyella sp. TaxID=1883156 RepID=UPI000F414B5A|nr:choice-of-anchor L domain-containing protein [Winogradskyella sp.]RNC84293.1 MAG: gliding motility-associated C-terminal domain-containing protein [Winogradskyella sp.]